MMTRSGTRVALLDRLPEKQEMQASSAHRAPSIRFYRPELDVLRFCAFLMVFLGHSMSVYPESSDWLKALKSIPGFGVPLFFALSAYLVTGLLATEKNLTGTVNTRFFYSRRILRIWPVYFLLLGIGFAVSRAYGGNGVPGLAVLSYLLLVGNWYTAQYGYLGFSLGALWSISIEEQFYLVWPWVVRFATRRLLALICFAAWICSQLSLLYMCYHHALNNPTIWTSSVVQLQYFAIGAGLSLYLNGSVPTFRGRLRFAIIIGAFLLFLVTVYLFGKDKIRGVEQHSSIAHTYPIYFLGGVSVLAILIGFLGCASLESWRVFRYLGKISYGLYVYYSVAFAFAARLGDSVRPNSQLFIIVTALMVDIGIAWVSYEYFEKPFMRMKERFSIVRSRAVE
jgi:peptidoglycan/LPS O-acetylase OafA/YrhL